MWPKLVSTQDLKNHMNFKIPSSFLTQGISAKKFTYVPENYRTAMRALPNISFFADAKAAALRICEVTDRTPTIGATEENGEILDQVRGEIEFKDVDFSYPSRPDTQILQRFNLKVHAGETIGLVGSSGSGKSTVISLLERFYDPVNGEILLDGCPLTRLQLKWLRSIFGLVSQEPILFAASIKENILFGKDGASMELVISAAKAANAHNFIAKLPEGYDTHVSINTIV